MYSLDFAIEVSRICMNEIRKRGLYERKILRKSEPNSVLLLKVFRKQNCKADDLTHVSIHSVATLMQDTLWCCQERIVSKKVWRVINYETCTLDELSHSISKRGQDLLVDILDFLVELMKYKHENQMDAYHLGEAMGKVTLGPADCDPILAEKASHFMTRMIIEHSKMIHNNNNKAMTKSEATRAKTKSYNRLIQKIRQRNKDWISIVHGSLYAMLENDYEPAPEILLGEPYVSIFSPYLDPSQAMTSPLLFRLVTAASQQVEPVPLDPFLVSPLFNPKKRKTVEEQISVAFDDFKPLLQTSSALLQQQTTEKSQKVHMKMIHTSLSHMKLNLKKHKSQSMPMNDEPASTSESDKTLYEEEKQHHSMKKMMKKVIKIVPTKKASHTHIY